MRGVRSHAISLLDLIFYANIFLAPSQPIRWCKGGVRWDKTGGGFVDVESGACVEKSG